ncbi:MAG TPA: dTMP kinase [Acidimicrobiia bacterium]|jgi:dTMP kinase
MTGRFIVLEGGDASGKSTQVARLVARLQGLGKDVIQTFEPGATAAGARIRSLLLDGDEPLVPAAEALLMAADRAQHVAEVVRPALARGTWVVSDRYVPSTLAYQGAGRALDPQMLERMSEWATDGLAADLVLVLDVPDDVAAARRSASDRMEREAEEFHSRVRDAYRRLARLRDWTVIDGSGDVDAVEEKLWSVVTERLSP